MIPSVARGRGRGRGRGGTGRGAPPSPTAPPAAPASGAERAAGGRGNRFNRRDVGAAGEAAAEDPGIPRHDPRSYRAESPSDAIEAAVEAAVERQLAALRAPAGALGQLERDMARTQAEVGRLRAEVGRAAAGGDAKGRAPKADVDVEAKVVRAAQGVSKLSTELGALRTEALNGIKVLSRELKQAKADIATIAAAVAGPGPPAASADTRDADAVATPRASKGRPDGQLAHPTHFIGVRISGRARSDLEQLQTRLIERHRALSPMRIAPVKLHLTLAVASLPNAEATEAAAAVVSEHAGALADACAKAGELTLAGVSSFPKGVLFAKVVNDGALKSLTEATGALVDALKGAGLGARLQTPAHVTLFKSRAGARGGGSRLRLSTLFTDAEVVEALPLGTSPVVAIQMMRIGSTAADGYFTVTAPPPPPGVRLAPTSASTVRVIIDGGADGVRRRSPAKEEKVKAEKPKEEKAVLHHEHVRLGAASKVVAGAAQAQAEGAPQVECVLDVLSANTLRMSLALLDG